MERPPVTGQEGFAGLDQKLGSTRGMSGEKKETSMRSDAMASMILT